MTNDLTPEEKAYLKFVQLRDEIKTLISNLITRLSEATQKQEDTTIKFIAHFDDFTRLSERVEKQIEDKITQCTSLTADLAGKQLTDFVKKDVTAIIDDRTTQLHMQFDTALNKLNAGITQVNDNLDDKKRVLKKTGYLVAGTVCLSGLLTAFGIYNFYPRTTICKLNDNMAHAYFVGERILNHWSLLSDQEKDKILSLTMKKS